MSRLRTLIPVCLFLLLLLCCLGFLRNVEVFNYRTGLIIQMDNAIKKDVARGIKLEKSRQWRIRKYDEVTYYQMFFQFWKPLNGFYKDKSFLK